jgi:hypothetical protein
MIEIKLKNKKVLTISDFHFESVHKRVLVYSPEMADELYNIFSYPQQNWGSNRVAIVKRDFTMMIKGNLPEYFVSIWVNGEPKDKKRYGSYLILSFFADWDGTSPFTELIEEYLPDLDEVFNDYSVDFDL